MKTIIRINLKSHTEVELVNSLGDTFTFDSSKHAELMDFLSRGDDMKYLLIKELEKIRPKSFLWYLLNRKLNNRILNLIKKLRYDEI